MTDKYTTLTFSDDNIQVTIAVPNKSVTTWMDYFNALFAPMLRASIGASMTILADDIYEEYGTRYEPDREVPNLQDSDTTPPDTTAPVKSAEANYKAWITTPTVNPYDIPLKEK